MPKNKKIAQTSRKKMKNNGTKSKKAIPKGMPKTFYAKCLIRADRDGFIAICVNLSLFAQAKTIETAIKKLEKAIIGYLNYVAQNHPDKWKRYFNRPAPQIYISLFEGNVELQKQHRISQQEKKYTELKRQCKSFQLSLKEQVENYKSIIPDLTFVKKISTPLSQANM